MLSGFLENVGIEQFTLGVHDFGGPIGLYWMIHNMEKVNRLLLFNTLVYPQFSWAVKLFGFSSILPGVKNWLFSPSGVKWGMQFGVYQKQKLSPEIIQNYQAPFLEKKNQKVLIKSFQRLSLKGYKEIEEQLKLFKGPIKIIYGEQDKILPKVSSTMKRVKEDCPQAEITSLPNCGHFLQEDEPEKISAIILDFMKTTI